MPGGNSHSNGAPWGGYAGLNKFRALPFDDFKYSRQYSLNVHETYTDWGPREAFRELWQNCIDAVIETNYIDRNRLFATHEAVGEANGEATPPTGDTEIVFKIFSDDDPEKCLAYVRYKGHNGFGTVEITNFGASLEKKDLRIGGSTKKTLRDQAGVHGEGLKLAALVLMRSDQDHDVFCQTSGCRLFFRFTKGGDLVVDAHRIKEEQKPESGQQPKNVTIPTPAVKAQGDVQFIIGQEREARDEDGDMGKRSPVSQTEFKDWIKIALLLNTKNGDENVISTDYGKLLTSEDLRGKLYLKGLLLRESTESRSASITGRRLGFGYDFARGKTNRERQSLANEYEQSYAISDILGAAVFLRPDLAGKICDILNSADPRYEEGEIDAGLWLVDGEDDQAASLMFKKVARRFKEYLLGGEFASRWLYSAGEMDKNPSLLQIIEGMGRHPFKLKDNLWGILQQHGLVNTVEQEALRWYEKARAVSVPDQSFAKSVSRLIRASVRACPQTEAMQVEFVEFVEAGQLYLDLHVSKTEPLIRIHKRWLHIDSAMTELGLEGDMAEAEKVAYAVKRLFADILHYLPREKFLDQGSSRLPDSQMKRECHRAEQRLAKYQQIDMRIVDQEDAGNPGLKVEWAVTGARQDDDSMIEIHVHQNSSCSELREKFHIAKDLEGDQICPESLPLIPRRSTHGRGWPTCIVHETKVHQGTLCVPDLGVGEEYFFVLVTPADPSSFVVMSDIKRVVAQPNIRPDASASASRPSPVGAQPSVRSKAPAPRAAPPATPQKEPVVAQSTVHSNAPARRSAPAAAPQKDATQVPSHVRNASKSPQVIRGSNSSASSSAPKPPEPFTEAPPPGRSHDAQDRSLVAHTATTQGGNSIAGPIAAHGATNHAGNNISSSLIARGATNHLGNDTEEESISRGPRLETAAVRNLGLPRHYGWYWNSGDVPAVIGITVPEEEVAVESRKRRRVD